MASRWVLVAYPVVALFEREMKKCLGRSESGGILIGSYRGPHIEITGFTTPAAEDIRHPYRFIKQDPRHQQAATEVWRASDGRDTYLGEWHTHPHGEPCPSTIDTCTWREVVERTKKPMIFAIIAPGRWGLFACRPRLLWRSVKAMAAVEHGQSGIVFGES
jgi:integrative and conjugative element protein (TIGR02256 family)